VKEDGTDERLLTTAEVAGMFRVHPTTIYRLLRRGEFPGFRIGDSWRISLESLELWLSNGGNFRDADQPDESS
jgi:excisionase family DNA binding protein